MRSFYRWLAGTRAGKALTSTVAVLLWLIVWHVAATRLGKPLLLPSPAAVAARLGELCATPAFWQYSLRSLLRVIAGIAGGALAAIVVAALTAAFAPVDLLLRPLITVVKTTPVASFIILAMLWLREGVLPVFISFLMVFPVIWANLHTALSSVPTEYCELAAVYRLPLLRRVHRIYAPYAFPHFLAACRSSMGLAWKAGIAAEAIALPAVSIGKQLMDSKIYLETTDLFAWTAVVVVLSLILETAATRLFRFWQTATDRTHGKEASA